MWLPNSSFDIEEWNIWPNRTCDWMTSLFDYTNIQRQVQKSDSRVLKVSSVSALHDYGYLWRKADIIRRSNVIHNMKVERNCGSQADIISSRRSAWFWVLMNAYSPSTSLLDELYDLFDITSGWFLSPFSNPSTGSHFDATRNNTWGPCTKMALRMVSFWPLGRHF